MEGEIKVTMSRSPARLSEPWLQRKRGNGVDPRLRCSPAAAGPVAHAGEDVASIRRGLGRQRPLRAAHKKRIVES
jgi:hypothetical protein